MPSKSRILLVKILFSSYLLLTQVVLPLLSPLRALGEIDPGELRNSIFPPLFISIIIALGLGQSLKARSILHIGLALAFISAMVLGIPNFLDQENQRAYISHLFQLASAYVMINVGWISKDWFSYHYWERFVALSLIATLISTIFTLGALERGDIGRLYTPAYAFIFITAFSAIFSRKMAFITIIGILVSNKRGPILSVFLIFLQTTISDLRSIKKKSLLLKKIIKGSTGAIIILIFTISAVNWYSTPEREESTIGRAVNITYNRLQDIIKNSDSKSLDEISSGRFEEIERALNDITGINFIFGSGAGWTIELNEGRKIQNIHFSPLSITAVFGAPFALFLYSYLILLIVRGIIRKDEAWSLSATERMAPLYLSGAVLHSIFAYSLFIDWLVFFFAGVLCRSLHKSQCNAMQQNHKILA